MVITKISSILHDIMLHPLTNTMLLWTYLTQLRSIYRSVVGEVKSQLVRQNNRALLIHMVSKYSPVITEKGHSCTWHLKLQGLRYAAWKKQATCCVLADAGSLERTYSFQQTCMS
jgi:hypothetical protein